MDNNLVNFHDATNEFRSTLVYDETIKSHYKLLEVSSQTGVKPYVLRYWESQFECLSPIISSTGHKVYEKSSIEIVSLIKNILSQKKKSIEELTEILKDTKNYFNAIKILKEVDESIENNIKANKLVGFKKTINFSENINEVPKVTSDEKNLVLSETSNSNDIWEKKLNDALKKISKIIEKTNS